MKIFFATIALALSLSSAFDSKASDTNMLEENESSSIANEYYDLLDSYVILRNDYTVFQCCATVHETEQMTLFFQTGGFLKQPRKLRPYTVTEKSWNEETGKLKITYKHINPQNDVDRHWKPSPYLDLTVYVSNFGSPNLLMELFNGIHHTFSANLVESSLESTLQYMDKYRYNYNVRTMLPSLLHRISVYNNIDPLDVKDIERLSSYLDSFISPNGWREDVHAVLHEIKSWKFTLVPDFHDDLIVKLLTKHQRSELVENIAEYLASYKGVSEIIEKIYPTPHQTLQLLNLYDGLLSVKDMTHAKISFLSKLYAMYPQIKGDMSLGYTQGGIRENVITYKADRYTENMLARLSIWVNLEEDWVVAEFIKTLRKNLL